MGAADLLDPALAHHDDAVAHAERLDLVVRDVERRYGQAFLQLDDFGSHLHAQGRVEIGERLVHEKDARLAHDCSAERHALPLAAGQLLRPPLQNLLDAQQLRGLAHAVLDFELRDFSQPHAERHVREHVEVGKQRVILEDHRDIAVVRQFVGYVLAVKQDLAVGSDLEAGDDAHRRGLAAARWADEDNEFAIRRGKGEVLNGHNIAEPLPHVTEFYSRHSSSPPGDGSVRKRLAGFCPDVLPIDARRRRAVYGRNVIPPRQTDPLTRRDWKLSLFHCRNGSCGKGGERAFSADATLPDCSFPCAADTQKTAETNLWRVRRLCDRRPPKMVRRKR